MNPRHREINSVARKMLNESDMIRLSQIISRRFYERGKQELPISGTILADELERVFREVYGDAVVAELADAMPDEDFLDRLDPVGLSRGETVKTAVTAWEIGLELSRIQCSGSPEREPSSCPQMPRNGTDPIPAHG